MDLIGVSQLGFGHRVWSVLATVFSLVMIKLVIFSSNSIFKCILIFAPQFTSLSIC